MTEQSQFQNRLTALVNQFPNRRLMVVGDIIADQFVYGEIARISREAPVMILKYENTRTLPGGASNAEQNAEAGPGAGAGAESENFGKGAGNEEQGIGDGIAEARKGRPNFGGGHFAGENWGSGTGAHNGLEGLHVSRLVKDFCNRVYSSFSRMGSGMARIRVRVGQSLGTTGEALRASISRIGKRRGGREGR